jgi:hypothetical protein
MDQTLDEILTTCLMQRFWVHSRRRQPTIGWPVCHVEYPHELPRHVEVASGQALGSSHARTHNDYPIEWMNKECDESTALKVGEMLMLVVI